MRFLGVLLLIAALLLPGTASAQNAAPPSDRLAAPPTVPAPTQADDGAQLYWLHCQPCHGDRGQGLTDEWRSQYPPDHQDCWSSGCHGSRPYEDGFTLPRAVPALIGDGTLQKFDTAATLYAFIHAQMPYQAASSLTDAEYYAITAYLLRARQRWDGDPLSQANVQHVLLFSNALGSATPTPTPTASAAQTQPVTLPTGWVMTAAGGLLLVLLATALVQRRTAA